MTDLEIALAIALTGSTTYTIGCRVTARRIARSMIGMPSGLFAKLDGKAIERRRAEQASQEGQSELARRIDELRTRLEGKQDSPKAGPYL